MNIFYLPTANNGSGHGSLFCNELQAIQLSCSGHGNGSSSMRSNSISYSVCYDREMRTTAHDTRSNTRGYIASTSTDIKQHRSPLKNLQPSNNFPEHFTSSGVDHNRYPNTNLVDLSDNRDGSKYNSSYGTKKIRSGGNDREMFRSPPRSSETRDWCAPSNDKKASSSVSVFDDLESLRPSEADPDPVDCRCNSRASSSENGPPLGNGRKMIHYREKLNMLQQQQQHRELKLFSKSQLQSSQVGQHFLGLSQQDQHVAGPGKLFVQQHRYEQPSYQAAGTISWVVGQQRNYYSQHFVQRQQQQQQQHSRYVVQHQNHHSQHVVQHQNHFSQHVVQQQNHFSQHVAQHQDHRSHQLRPSDKQEQQPAQHLVSDEFGIGNKQSNNSESTVCSAICHEIWSKIGCSSKDTGHEAADQLTTSNESSSNGGGEDSHAISSDQSSDSVISKRKVTRKRPLKKRSFQSHKGGEEFGRKNVGGVAENSDGYSNKNTGFNENFNSSCHSQDSSRGIKRHFDVVPSLHPPRTDPKKKSRQFDQNSTAGHSADESNQHNRLRQRHHLRRTDRQPHSTWKTSSESSRSSPSSSASSSGSGRVSSQSVASANGSAYGIYAGISSFIWDFFENHQQQKETYIKKMNLRDALYAVMRSLFPYCGLYVIGSSMTGFGSAGSDMDLCLMLSHNEIDQKRGATDILRFLHKKLSQCSFLQDIKLIHARVPILKFTDKISRVECDLNINNSVGIRNTHLLNAYSSMDWRVAPLVLFIKNWAKVKGINSPSTGSLSSYSVVLMVIHYLQYGCSPPLLPSLQQKYPHKFNNSMDVKSLSLNEKLAPYSSPNKMSLGQLFVGFMDYFASKFQFDQSVMSVRTGQLVHLKVFLQSQPVNCHSQWKHICIEEPFNLTNTAYSVFDPSVYRRIVDQLRRCHQLLSANPSLSVGELLDSPTLVATSTPSGSSVSPIANDGAVSSSAVATTTDSSRRIGSQIDSFRLENISEREAISRISESECLVVAVKKS